MPNNKKSSKKNQDNGKTKVHKVPTKKRKTNKKVNGETQKVPQVKKSTRNKKQRKKHPKLMLAFKILIVLFLLVCVVGAGIVAGLFFGLFGDEFEISKSELKIGVSNSVVVDQNGAVIANLSGDEKRKIITLEEMADYLPKAYVAIEDERYYSHHGVDFKRTAGAILKTLMGNSSYGGSTITQQLVKNVTKDDESEGMAGIFRKVKEWAKAYQVERMISKDQILELYLNILYVGGEGNLHGVELGANYYFNKSAKDLSLVECAYLAGINSSPNYYNPYKLVSSTDTVEKRDERIKNKTITVLGKMKELGYIQNEEEYNAAVEQAKAGLAFTQGTTGIGTTYSYHTDAVITQVIEQVMEEKDITRQLAENYVYSSGLTIYSTVDSSIQTRLEEEYKKDKYIKSGKDKNQDGTLKNEHTQSGMAVIDYKTGYVVGVAGGLGEKNGAGWNRATQMKKQTGSSIKPIADVAPALEERIITPATTYYDTHTDFGGNYKPRNDGGKYKNNYVNIREFISLSKNVPAVKIMKELTPLKSIEYLKKMGLESLDETEDNVLSLALGGITHGASPLEMAAAYGTIANDGVYITPTFYTKVVDASGNTVLTPKQEQTRVFTEQVAYLTKSITQEPTKGSGTATYCAISGMDVAAKTGTTDSSYDRWLCGFTPYYSAATWFGFDDNEEVRGFGQNPAGQIWDAVMTDIHKNLAGARFTKPSGIVEQTVCRVTGGLATSTCTSTYREMFVQNNIPGRCEGHGKQLICTETGKVATDFCSQYCATEEKIFGTVAPKEQLNLWKPVNGKNLEENKVEEICDIHTKPKEEEKPPVVDTPNTTNTNTNTTTTNTNTNTTNTNTTNTNTNTNTNTTTQKPDDDKNTAGEDTTNTTPAIN